MLRNLKIGARLMAGFLAITLILLGLGAFSQVALSSLSGQLAYFHGTLLKAVASLASSQENFLEARALVFEHILASDEAMQGMETDIADSLKNMSDSFDAYRPLADTADEKKLVAEYDTLISKFKMSTRSVLALSTSKQLAAAKAMADTDTLPLGNSLSTTFDTLVKLNVEQADSLTKKAVAASLLDLEISAVIMALALALALILGIFTTRVIVRPLYKLGQAAKLVASGDLSKEVDKRITARGDQLGDLARALETMRKDLSANIRSIETSSRELGLVGGELGSATATTADAIKGIVGSVGAARERVLYQSSSVTETSATIDQILRSIENLNGEIESQAAGVNQSSASIEEMVSNIQAVTKTVEQMGSYFVRLQEASEDGRSKLLAMVETTKGVVAQSEKLYEANAAISSIAKQTNLLAMNAAIEAAHAGDSGKGFAVVADEIRNLAESSALRSREVASDIKTIKGLIDSVSTTSSAAEAAFTLVMENLEEVSRFEHEIKEAMIEQNQGSKQILEAIEEINTVTGHVRNGSSEITVGSKTIGGEMRNLATASEELKAGIGGIETATSVIDEAAGKVKELAVRNEATVKGLSDIVAKFTL
jgi:methyl-accepting chemotaxis protein